MQVEQLEIGRSYVYRMYNRGKKRLQEYPVIYKGVDSEYYLFDMVNVDGRFTLPKEQVLEYIK